MNILFVYFDKIIQNDNLYVKSLCEEIRRQNGSVECSIDAFWNSPRKYDIVHIQFPEVIFKWRQPSDNGLKALRQRIARLKSMGYVDYEPYSLVHLTEAGMHIGRDIAMTLSRIIARTKTNWNYIVSSKLKAMRLFIWENIADKSSPVYIPKTRLGISSYLITYTIHVDMHSLRN